MGPAEELASFLMEEISRFKVSAGCGFAYISVLKESQEENAH